MVKVYFFRHGKALRGGDDALRELSIEGREETARAAKLLAQAGVSGISRIYHSGLVRSVQTAEIIAAEVPPAEGLVQMEQITPFDQPEYCASLLIDLDVDVIIAGHEPHLSHTASFLMSGYIDAVSIKFNYSGAICLEKSKNKQWYIVPIGGFE